MKRFGQLQIDLFVKASDSHQHLQYGPCHARACKTDIPFARIKEKPGAKCEERGMNKCGRGRCEVCNYHVVGNRFKHAGSNKEYSINK